MLQSIPDTIPLCPVPTSLLPWHIFMHPATVTVTDHITHHFYPPPHCHGTAHQHSRLLPTCLLCRYYSRYKIQTYITYTSATSQTGCSHDFLVRNNDARWPELPDNVAHIYFINDDIFQYSRVIVSKFYAFLVFSFTN